MNELNIEKLKSITGGTLTKTQYRDVLDTLSILKKNVSR